MKKLCLFLLENWQSPNYHLKTRHDLKQGNSYDCGVAVIALIKRISEKYQSDMENIELGSFDFKQERKTLRTEYLSENETN